MNREAERKRLVELLSQFERTCPDNCTGLEKSCTQCVLEQKADHILDDGWMRPPVKAGQTVYTIIDCKKHAEKLVITGVHYYSKYLSFGALSRSQKQYYFEDDDIGKTVFTSREDAEKALKGEGK